MIVPPSLSSIGHVEEAGHGLRGIARVLKNQDVAQINQQIKVGTTGVGTTGCGIEDSRSEVAGSAMTKRKQVSETRVAY